MSVDNISVVYRPNSPTPVDIQHNSMSVASVTNSTEEPQTNNRTCCQRVANGLRSAARWLRNLFCCCRPRADRSGAYDMSGENTGAVNTAFTPDPDPEPNPQDGSGLPLTDLGAVGGHPDDGQLEAETNLDDVPPITLPAVWETRVAELTTALIDIVAELDFLTTKMNQLMAEFTLKEQELNRLTRSQALELSNQMRIEIVTSRMTNINNQIQQHSERHRALLLSRSQIEAELSGIKTKYGLR